MTYQIRIEDTLDGGIARYLIVVDGIGEKRSKEQPGGRQTEGREKPGPPFCLSLTTRRYASQSPRPYQPFHTRHTLVFNTSFENQKP